MEGRDHTTSAPEKTPRKPFQKRPWVCLISSGCWLTDLFARARAGQGQVVFVAGEAGIGKSRLLLEVRRRLVTAGEPATWLEGRCFSFGQSSPLLPVVEDAEAQLSGPALTIESIAARLATPRLRRSFLTAEPVARLFRALGRTPPRSE